MAGSFNELFGIGSHSEDANIEGWWPLQDDAASTAVDDASSNTRDGTLAGGDNTADISTTGPNSYLAKALDFDGTADYVNSMGAVADFSFVQNSLVFTFSGWVRFDSASGRYGFFGNILGSSDKGFFLLFENSGVGTDALRVLVGSGSVVIDAISANGVINDTNWHHVAVTSGSAADDMLFYIDGTASTTTYRTSFSSLSTGDSTRVLTAGRSNHSSSSLLLDGKMAGWSIYSREWTSAEVDQDRLGPELNYSSGVSFAANGAYNIGTWALPSPFASGSNGSQTQEVIAVNAAGSVLDGTKTTATGTMDLSSEAGNTCYLLARVSNSGGYDIGDKATRTSAYGSSNDGYYEIASVTAAGGGGVTIRQGLHRINNGMVRSLHAITEGAA